jgi:crotonobetainyl-CoA:carnitine CoA-transferase CaiB-like acyl-CoA transferase
MPPATSPVPGRFAPLEGVRVLDLSKVLAGPQCAQYLGELGADVIKVEPIGTGDDTRHWPPFQDGTGTVFVSANRNKRSIALDLKSAEGRAICHRLAAKADVVIESFGPGVAARLGVDADTLCALNPRLVHCGISGFGTVGPMREGKGYDVILQAFSGMISITGEPDGPPARSPFSPVDQGTGLHAVIGILGGLMQRDRTGHGCRVEASLFDTSVSFLAYFLQGYWTRGTEPVRAGSGHESLCPYQVFDTKDRPLILGVANDALWVAFCRVAGVPALATREGLRTNAERVARRAETVAIVAELMRGRTRDEWMGLLDEAGIPCSPVHSLGELSAHPHTRESGMVYDTESAAGRPARAVSTPLRVDGERPAPRRPVPGLGAHSDAVLREAGYAESEIEDLHRRGVVAQGDGRA